MSVLDPLLRPVQDEADKISRQILSGQCSDWADFKARLAKREGLLKAIELVKRTANNEEGENSGSR